MLWILFAITISIYVPKYFIIYTYYQEEEK